MLKKDYCPHLPLLKATGSWSFTPNLKVRKGQVQPEVRLRQPAAGVPRSGRASGRSRSGSRARSPTKTLRVVITGTVTRDNDNLNDCKDVHINETHVLKQKVF